MSCPDENELALLGEAALDDAERSALEAHIDRCAKCDALVRELASLAAVGTTDSDVPTVPPRYRLLRRLGSGGMGVVWEAEDRELRRRVALKVARKTGDASLRARLVREARMIAGVTHRNVVTVYDVGEYADQPYVAMELVEGMTARAWRAAAVRTTSEILDVWCAAASGLYALHQQRIVHRDVKPENVLVADDGRVVICDLGLATDESSWTLTRTGHAVGTLAYMAPEQARGDDVDARSDVHAWAVATWEAITGRHPFADRSTKAAPLAITPAAAVLAVLGAGMMQARVDRPTLDVLLERLASARNPPDATSGASRRRHVATALGLAVAVFVLGGGVWHLTRTAARATDAPVPGDRARVLAGTPDDAIANALDAEDVATSPFPAGAVARSHAGDAARIINAPATRRTAANTIDVPPAMQRIAAAATVDAGELPELTIDAAQHYRALEAEVRRAEAAVTAGDVSCQRILAALPPATPELGTSIADRIALVKPSCEMVSGDCVGGKQHLAALLRAKGAADDAIVRELSGADAASCPIDAAGTPAERTARVYWRLVMANARSQPCAAIVDAAEAANIKPSPMFALNAAPCLARAGQCARAARYIETDEQRAELVRLFPRCTL